VVASLVVIATGAWLVVRRRRSRRP
jgi:hypothetical protein